MNATKLNSLIKLSHERQFNGVDWQTAATDLTPDNLPQEEREEVYKKLCEGPDPGCECGFCATAPWVD